MSDTPVTAPATSIPCSLTEAEKEALGTVARDMGYKNISHFVRGCIMDKAGGQISNIVHANLSRRESQASALKVG